jgi:aminopeptidase N
MKWWNDLWLNESFATVISYISYAMTSEQASIDSWLQFVEETRWAYEDDLIPASHSIEAPCDYLDVAQGLIDGITYGKGAALLRQIIHYVGKEHFFAGCRAYFEKFAWGNSTLVDFFECL